jgi:hypothetical protein
MKEYCVDVCMSNLVCKDMRELPAAQQAFAADGDVTVDGVDGRPGATLVQSIDHGLFTAAVLS